MDGPQRGRHGFRGRQDDRMPGGLSLELRERVLEVRQRVLRIRRELSPAGALDLVQRTHRLRDRRRKLEQVCRHVRIPLQGIQPSRERFACGSG
jgi:hypothetical protein